MIRKQISDLFVSQRVELVHPGDDDFILIHLSLSTWLLGSSVKRDSKVLLKNIPLKRDTKSGNSPQSLASGSLWTLEHSLLPDLQMDSPLGMSWCHSSDLESLIWDSPTGIVLLSVCDSSPQSHGINVICRKTEGHNFFKYVQTV